MNPLRDMGASIAARDGRFPPLVVHGRTLKPIEYTLPDGKRAGKVQRSICPDCTPTARLRSTSRCGPAIIANLRWGIRGRCRGEPPDHKRDGASASASARTHGPRRLVFGGIFLIAALIVAESDLTIHGVGLNPTRSALLDFLAGMGAPNQNSGNCAGWRRAGGRSSCAQIASEAVACWRRRLRQHSSTRSRSCQSWAL